MTPEYFFNQLRTPINWKHMGWNHSRNELTEEITVYGKVFDDWHNKKIIRVCFDTSSCRCMIVERTAVNFKPKYRTVCNLRALELDTINNFITNKYQ